MKLFYSSASPYARKVLVVAREAGLDSRIELVPASVVPMKPEPTISKANPLKPETEAPKEHPEVKDDAQKKGDEPQGKDEAKAKDEPKEKAQARPGSGKFVDKQLEKALAVVRGKLSQDAAAKGPDGKADKG